MVYRIESAGSVVDARAVEGLSAADQAQLVMWAKNSGNPDFLKLVEQLGLVSDRFSTAAGGKLDPQIAAQGRNLNSYTAGPSLDAVAKGESLHIGHKGEGVKDLQRLLNSMGANLDVDGKFGPKTEAALRSYQATKGANDNGVLNADSLGRLRQGGDRLTPEQWGRHQPDYDRDKGTLEADRERVYGAGAPPVDLAGLPNYKGGAPVDKLFTAITGQESGGNHGAINPHSGALGIGQVMPANIRSWSKEALGQEISPETFKSRPDLQNKIVRFKLDQYYQQGLQATGGDQREAVRYAASKWYSGDGNKRNNTRAQTYGAGSYPSIKNYSDNVLKRFLS